MLVYADRVLETSTTTGAGALTLAAAVTGYQRFSGVCSVNDTVYYAIWGVDANGTPTGEWESGLGTYSSANTLTRTTVLASSNSNAAVSFSAGTKHVGITPVAADYSVNSKRTLFTAQPPTAAVAVAVAAAASNAPMMQRPWAPRKRLRLAAAAAAATAPPPQEATGSRAALAAVPPSAPGLQPSAAAAAGAGQALPATLAAAPALVTVAQAAPALARPWEQLV
jgi:hypothetical protein